MNRSSYAVVTRRERPEERETDQRQQQSFHRQKDDEREHEAEEEQAALHAENPQWIVESPVLVANALASDQTHGQPPGSTARVSR